MVLTEAEQSSPPMKWTSRASARDRGQRPDAFAIRASEPFVLQGIDLKDQGRECIAISGASAPGRPRW